MRQFLKTNAQRAANFLRYGANDPQHFYVVDKRRIVYIDNPKVASTSIKQALYGAQVDYGLGQDAFHKVIDGYSTKNYPRSASDYLAIAVVRDPFSRLVSNYKDKVEGRAPKDWGVYNVRYYRLLFSQLGGMKIGAEPVSFDAFAWAVTRISDALADRHFASQSRWWPLVPHPDRVRILRFEALSEDWQKLRDEVNLPELDVLNQTPSRDWTAYYTDQSLIDAVAQRYARDLDRFGYTPPSPAAASTAP